MTVADTCNVRDPRAAVETDCRCTLPTGHEGHHLCEHGGFMAESGEGQASPDSAPNDPSLADCWRDGEPVTVWPETT